MQTRSYSPACALSTTFLARHLHTHLSRQQQLAWRQEDLVQRQLENARAMWARHVEKNRCLGSGMSDTATSDWCCCHELFKPVAIMPPAAQPPLPPAPRLFAGGMWRSAPSS